MQRKRETAKGQGDMVRQSPSRASRGVACMQAGSWQLCSFAKPVFVPGVLSLPQILTSEYIHAPCPRPQALEVEHRAHAGQAAAHLLGVPSPPVAASLPAAAPATMPGSERAATSAAQPAAGLLAPSAAERAAKPAAPPLASEPVLPAAGQRAAAPAPAHAAMAAASALEQPKQSRHRVEAAALGPEGRWGAGGCRLG